MFIVESRWTRLEKYSRWKSGRFNVTSLPFDIIDLITKFLDYHSHCSFLAALTGTVPDMSSVSSMNTIPETLRPRWIIRTAEERLYYQLQEFVFKHIHSARHVDGCVVLINWSQFSEHEPVPIFVFTWHTSRYHEDRYEMLNVIRRCASCYHPCVRATLHTYINWSNQTVINPQPIDCCNISILPWWIIPPTTAPPFKVKRKPPRTNQVRVR